MWECDLCDKKQRKKNSYLCQSILGLDDLCVRCIHKNTLSKLNHLEYYLSIFCTAMKSKFANRIFIDLFSGPGFCINKDNLESREFKAGSALIALNQKTPFTDYIFVDRNETTLDTLTKRCKAKFPELMDRIKFCNFDSNRDIENILKDLVLQNTIIVVFIDPNGLDIEYETIRRLAKFPCIDLIINFSIMDQKRNEIINRIKISEKADRFFGTEEWRTKNKSEWLALYKSQLTAAGFEAVEDDFEGSAVIKTRTNAPIYYLVYASKKKVGLRFWEITKDHFNPQKGLFDRKMQ